MIVLKYIENGASDVLFFFEAWADYGFISMGDTGTTSSVGGIGEGLSPYYVSNNQLLVITGDADTPVGILFSTQESDMQGEFLFKSRLSVSEKSIYILQVDKHVEVPDNVFLISAYKKQSGEKTNLYFLIEPNDIEFKDLVRKNTKYQFNPNGRGILVGKDWFIKYPSESLNTSKVELSVYLGNQGWEFPSLIAHQIINCSDGYLTISLQDENDSLIDTIPVNKGDVTVGYYIDQRGGMHLDLIGS